MGQKWYPSMSVVGGGEGSLQHLLSGCPRSLSEGRYRWRHDQVLKVIAGVVSEALKSNRFSPGRHKVIFVRAGSSKQPQTKNKVSMLSSAPDWHLLVDLERQTKFPAHIVETKLRPDLVYVFKFHKEGDNVGIVSPMGRKHGVHTRKKDSQIWAASRAMSNEWLAGNMPGSRSGMSWI